MFFRDEWLSFGTGPPKRKNCKPSKFYFTKKMPMTRKNLEIARKI
jgi:hypothetical protein